MSNSSPLSVLDKPQNVADEEVLNIKHFILLLIILSLLDI